MFPITFHSEDVFLLPYGDGVEGQQLKLSLMVEASRAAEGAQARRPETAFLRSQYQFSITIEQAERIAFSAALRLLGDKRVLCPYWGSVQAADEETAPPLATGIWLIAERDLSAWEVNETGTAGTFSPSEDAFRVPLMLGHFAEEPDPAAADAGTLSVGIKFQEAGAAEYALMPDSFNGTAGPTLANGQTPREFPLAPEWSTEPKAGSAHVEITREQIGYGREPAVTYSPQTPERGLQFGFTTCSASEIAALVGFFVARQSSVENFWLPGALNEATLASDISSATIALDNVAAFVVGDYVALIDLEADSVTFRKIAAIDAEAKTLTLASSPGAHAAAYTRVVHAVLARFKTPELTLKITDTEIAQAVIAFVEVPKEYADDAGEEIGVTHGPLPRKAWLYKFSRKHPTGFIYFRYTSDERPVTVGEETYAKDRNITIEHTEIPDTLDFENASVSITMRVCPGNPLLLIHSGQLEGLLYCEILLCFPDADNVAASAESKWYGIISEAPNFDGPIITAQVNHVLRYLQRNVPTAIVGLRCIWRVYTEPCGVDPDDFTEDATIVSITDEELVIAIAGDFEAGYFAYGKIWCGEAETYQLRSIKDSTESSDGNVTLTLEKAFSDVAVDDAVTLRPSCDRSPEVCEGRFANYPNFFGGRYVPPGNPSLLKITQNQTSGGKK